MVGASCSASCVVGSLCAGPAVIQQLRQALGRWISVEEDIGRGCEKPGLGQSEGKDAPPVPCFGRGEKRREGSYIVRI